MISNKGNIQTTHFNKFFEKDKQYLTDLVASGKLGLTLQNNIEKFFIDNGEINRNKGIKWNGLI